MVQHRECRACVLYVCVTGLRNAIACSLIIRTHCSLSLTPLYNVLESTGNITWSLHHTTPHHCAHLDRQPRDWTSIGGDLVAVHQCRLRRMNLGVDSHWEHHHCR